MKIGPVLILENYSTVFLIPQVSSQNPYLNDFGIFDSQLKKVIVRLKKLRFTWNKGKKGWKFLVSLIENV